MNGLYDLPNLVRNPGAKHAQWKQEYGDFIRAAFGDDEIVWKEVSPISVQNWVEEWGRKDGRIILVQSKEDSLVPYWQTENMREALKQSNIDVSEMEDWHDHDEIWEKGDRLAEIVAEAIRKI